MVKGAVANEKGTSRLEETNSKRRKKCWDHATAVPGIPCGMLMCRPMYSENVTNYSVRSKYAAFMDTGKILSVD